MRLPSVGAGAAPLARIRAQAQRRIAQQSPEQHLRMSRRAAAVRTFLQFEDEERAKRESGEDVGAEDCALGGALGVTLAEELLADMQQWDAETGALFAQMTGMETAKDAATAAQQCFTALFCSRGKLCEAPGLDGDTGKNCFNYLRVLGNFFPYAPLLGLLAWLATNAKCFRPDVRLGDSLNYFGEDVPQQCTVIQGVYDIQPFIGPDGRCYRIRGNL
jgi:hypothetical protein